MEIERQERESRVKLVEMPLNNIVGDSTINSHDVDASRRSYFIENMR